MNFTYRSGRLEDFQTFYRHCFPVNNDKAHQKIVHGEWEVLLNNPTTMTMIVEDEDCPADSFIGCGQGVFVTEKLARFLCQGLPPWINAQLTKPLPDGSWPLLDEDGVARANATTGLIGVTTRWVVRRSIDPDIAIKLWYGMHRWFERFSSGYNFKELWIEATGPAAKDEAIRAGFTVVDDYKNYCDELPYKPDSRPYLLRLTRAEATSQPGSLMNHIFAFTPPLGCFSRREKKILQLALDNRNDSQIGQELGLSPHTINKAWRDIYQCAADSLPLKMPTGQHLKRGPEKRTLVLDYVRRHPEELRPYHKPMNKPVRTGSS